MGTLLQLRLVLHGCPGRRGSGAIWYAVRRNRASATNAKKPPLDTDPLPSPSEIASRSSSRPSDVSVLVKVQQAGKDIFWTGIVLAGVGVTGLMAYAIFRELFSSQSPSVVYDEAFKLCKKDVRVQSILGSPIKAYGDLGSLRGRRRHVKSATFSENSVRIIQVEFYVSGPFNSATVFVEKDVSNSNFRKLTFRTDDGREYFSLLEAPEKQRVSTLFG